MRKKLLKAFQNPGNVYRGAPFWAWNGRLEPEELRRQVRVFHKMGMGGFFMHARVGLETSYLSDEWFECINVCLDEAKKLDMQAWLYDEDRWPSGAAGGLVTEDRRYAMRALGVETFESGAGVKWQKNTVGVFRVKMRGDLLLAYAAVPRGKKPALQKGEVCLVFSELVQMDNDWFNGQTYLDTLNHEAVQKYIESTHEAYRKRCAERFGKEIPGIFTDEPNHGGVLEEAGPFFGRSAFPHTEDVIPWTPGLPKVFRERYGYDVRQHLPALFFASESEGDVQARYHYHDCKTFLFTDAFSRQLGEWCEQNKLQLTGHVLYEDPLDRQVSLVGSAMRFYEHMQAPGIDNLTEYWREYTAALGATSVARQFNRTWRLSELYGCTGWDFPLAGHKAVGHWQTALGINLRCQHLSYYTMEGEAKRDYPASIFHQSPWWESYPKVEDYFARLHVVLTQGQEKRELLMLHPNESLWTRFTKGWQKDSALQRFVRKFERMTDALFAGNLGFDYGDEDILARHGRVSSGKEGPRLRVNKASYSTVLVPPLWTIRASTLKILERFQKAGGQVVFAGTAPKMVDALPSTDARTLAKKCRKAPAQGEALVEALSPLCRRVSVLDGAGKESIPVLYQLREDRDHYYLFLCNASHDFTAQSAAYMKDPRALERTLDLPDLTLRLFVDTTGAPLELDPDTGEVFDAQGKREKSGWRIATSLKPLGGRLFLFPKKKSGYTPAPRPQWQDVRKRTLGGSWNYVLSENNNLTLDRPRYKVAKDNWKGPRDILEIDCQVRKALGVKPRGGAMFQPWAREAIENPKSTPVVLRYDFAVKEIPSGDIFLAIEHPERFQMSLNGYAVSNLLDAGWWVDKSMRKVRLDPAFLVKGSNRLELTLDYDETFSGLENVYLLGLFGVQVSGTDVSLISPAKKLKTGDWVRQGLPFYSGSVLYQRHIREHLEKGERLFVQVPAYAGTAVRVLVNGREAGVIAWEPNECDITELMQDGAGELTIEVLGSRRNSHGPLHMRKKHPDSISPLSFLPAKEERQENYNLAPCGLLSAPRLVVRAL